MIEIRDPQDTRLDMVEVLEAKIIWKLNSEYMVKIKLLADSVHIGSIAIDNIVVVEDEDEKEQKFRITYVTRNLEVLIVEAYHISYDLTNDIIVNRAWNNKSARSIWQELLEAGQSERRFTGYSDISTINSIKCVRTSVLLAILGKADNSFVSRFGGELERDNYRINMLERLGFDNDFTVRYRKNLSSIEIIKDDSTRCNRIIPTYINANKAAVHIPGIYIDSPRINQTAVPRTKTIHYEDIAVGAEDEGIIKYPTEQLAIEEVRRRVEESWSKGLDTPQITINVNFVDLAQTEEYKEYRLLEKLHKGDSVRVEFDDITLKERLIEYEWDALKLSYEKLVLGESLPSTQSVLATINTNIQNTITEKFGSDYYPAIVSSIQAVNEAVANANGYFITVRENSNGSKITYYHDQRELEKSQVIETFPASGTRVWTNEGWNNGNPNWTYGYTNNGELVMKVISTTGVNAEWVKLEGAPIAEHIDNLNTNTNTRIDQLGLTVQNNTYINGAPVSQAFAQLNADYLALTQTIEGLTTGGGNYVRNASWGDGEHPDSSWWRSGLTWGTAKERDIKWGTLKSNSKTWGQAKEGVI